MLGSKKYRTKKIGAIAVTLFILGFFIGTPIGNLLGSTNAPAKAHLNIVYGSEKATWMGAVQIQFSKWWKLTYPDFPITTDFVAEGSAATLVGILDQEIKPVIWSPAASFWIPILNTKWGAQSAYHNETIIANTTYVIYSPVIIATWESFVQKYNITGFNSLYNLILANPGVVKLAHTDPTLSNSGYMAVIMELSAFLHKDPSQITMDDLTNTTVQAELRVIEGTAVEYGDSTGNLATMMANRGPSAINVAIMYENLVPGITNSTKGDKIVAIYPDEGTLLSDHPFCILNASWVTPNDAFVAEKFIEFIQRPDIIQLAIENGFRPLNRSIPLDPNIFNYNNDGISPTYSSPTLSIPNSGEVIQRIPDIWQLTRGIM